MRNHVSAPRRPALERIARVAFAFLAMNCAAVAGLVSAITGREVWRQP
jgi:hypothetical protein